MAFFRKKEPQPTGLVGVDIGAGGIKAVELTKEKGRMRLLTYGYSVMTNPEASTKSLLDDPKKAGKTLQEIWKKAGMKSVRANASLPSHSVFHAIITVPKPKDPKENIKPMIETQVKKLLPLPIEEMILDSTVIDKPDDNKKDLNNLRVLISGAPKTLVSKYVELFKYARMELVSLETEAFALIRSLVGNDKSRVLIVDVGYERTNITVVQQGVPFLHRSIKAGGSSVTAMIAKQMGISIAEAEQTKRDLMTSDVADLPPVLKESMQPILHEVKYSLELFAAQDFNEQTNIEKIIVTGGSAHLPQLDRFLTDALNLNVYLGDPWARVATPTGLRPVLDEVGPRFSVSIGLAMKEIDAKK